MVMISGCLFLLLPTLLHSTSRQLTAAAPVAAEGNGDNDRHHAVVAAPVGVAQVGAGPEAEGDGLTLSRSPTLADEWPLAEADPRVVSATVLEEILGLPPDKDKDREGPGREREGGAVGEELEPVVLEAMEEEKDEEGGVEATDVVKGGPSDEKTKRMDDLTLQGALEELRSFTSSGGHQGETLQRLARGYFPNIDLGLQDNEILPPLKGYKLYNQELARAGKKMKWQEEESQGKNGPLYNALSPAAVAPPDDIRVFTAEEEEEEEEVLTREEEEARARAEQEEIRRQVEEAQRNREEEAKLADIASDMLLQYMVKKQASVGGYQAFANGDAAEDKRSEEEDDDDVDPQTIDKLIEISSKLHLPADDVVDIISDVGKKKRRKKKKASPEIAPPRYRPLMPPPAFLPVPPYPAPRPAPLKQLPPYLGPYPSPPRKWYQDKMKMKASKQRYWGKPPKQLLAYPSYPFYQKPYRAYYPVYFPSPRPKSKSRYYTKPVVSFDDMWGNSMDYYDFKPVKGWYPPWKSPGSPQSPYISNYILPHPRTYRPFPIPKPRPPALQRQSVYYVPAGATMANADDEYYGGAEQQDSIDDELENFIEKIYMKRRMYK